MSGGQWHATLSSSSTSRSPPPSSGLASLARQRYFVSQSLRCHRARSSACHSTLFRIENGLPLAYEVTLRYEGPSGRKYGEGEEYRLDIGIYDVVYTGPKGLPELVAEVNKIRSEM